MCLTALPGSLGLLKCLKRLDLSRCVTLAVPPESLTGLTSLTALELGGSWNLMGLYEAMQQTLPDLRIGQPLQFAGESPGSDIYVEEIIWERCVGLLDQPDSLFYCKEEAELGEDPVLMIPFAEDFRLGRLPEEHCKRVKDALG